MKHILLYFGFAILLILTNSCNTKIDVNADYKDITVVYALINPADSVHYIKINKAFLKDNVNANTLAADANNFNYPAADLAVTVEEWNGSNLVKSFSTITNTLFRTVNEIPKDPGIFDNTQNVLYKFIEPNVNVYDTYKLKIHNNKLNKDVTAATQIVKPSVVSKPTVNQSIGFWLGGLATGTYKDNIISITTGKDVGRVSAALVFNYNEHYTDSTISPKSLSIPLGEVIAKTNQGNESLEWTLTGETFFSTISGAIDPNTPFLAYRELTRISLTFVVAGTELSTFMQVSAPSNNLNQEKPPYTNVDNGLGIFSSRTTINWVSSAGSPSNPINITSATITKLNSLGLGFCFGTTGTYKCN